MRPLLIPLLLLCALLAFGDAQQKCDKSLIKGVTDSELDFDPNDVKCRKLPGILHAIEFNSVLYSYLKCDEVDGWSVVFSNGTSQRIARAESTLNLTCVKYCAVTGEGIKVTQWGEQIDVECGDRQNRMFYDGKHVEFDFATCGLDLGWNVKTQSEDRFEHDQPLQLDCKHACHPETLGGVQSIVDSSTIGKGSHVFSCHDTAGIEGKYRMKVNGDFVESPLRCHHIHGYHDADGGWVADTYEPVKLECAIPPPCSLRKWHGPEAYYASFLRKGNGGSNKLSCIQNWTNDENVIKTEGVLRIVKYKTERVEELKCDAVNGWQAAGPGEDRRKIAEASIPLAATCHQYCAATGSPGVKVEVDYPKYHENVIPATVSNLKSVIVSCSDKNDLLLHDDKIVGKMAICDKKEWSIPQDRKIRDTSVVIRKDTSISTHFECRAPPCSLKKLYGREYHLSPLVITEVRGKIKLTCRNGLNFLGSVKYNTHRYPQFTCDTVDGWKAGGSDTIAEASVPLDATCEQYCIARESDGVEVKMSSNEGRDAVVASCTDKSHHLFYNGKHIGITATCSDEIDGGWYTGRNESKSVFGKDITAPMQFECRDATVPPTPATPTNAPSRPEMYNPSNSSADFIYHPPATTMETIAEAETGDNTLLIVGGCVGGVLLLIGVIVILVLFVFKKKRPERRPQESSGNATSRRTTEKGKRTKRSGSNSNKSTRSEVGSVRSEQKS